MSVLNQLFNRGILGAKCKTCLTLAISRLKLLQNKREAQLKLMRKEIAQFLLAGQEPIARIRVEHVIREQNTWEAYEILEMFCEFVLARVPVLESQKDCPNELKEAVASIIFSAPRCSDLPDLLQVRNLFASKYGKEFIAAASELRPDASVNRTIIEKLSVSAPPAGLKLKVLKEIALEYNVNWDSAKTEAEFSKKPEDLLNGPKQVAVQSQIRTRAEVHEQSSKMGHPVTSLNGKDGIRYLQSPSSVKSPSPSVAPSEDESSTRDQSANKTTVTMSTSPQPCDALQMAYAAIAAAERASAAARAAAELVHADFTPLKLEESRI